MLGILYLEVFELHYVRMPDCFEDLDLCQQILHWAFIQAFLTDHLHSHRLPAVSLEPIKTSDQSIKYNSQPFK